MTYSRYLLQIVLVPGLLAIGCDSSPPGTESDGGSDAAPAVGNCNALTFLGADYRLIARGPDAPTLQGGAIAPGTYVPTAANFYSSTRPVGADTDPGDRLTVVIDGDRWEEVYGKETRGKTKRSSWTFTVAGNRLTMKARCVDEATDETTRDLTFEASGRKLTVRELVPGGGPVDVVYETR